jgi:ABC-type glutathione transport system ATPase component
MEDEWEEHDRAEIEAQRQERDAERDAERAAEHDARPDDLNEPGDRCKDCGDKITWVGPGHTDWEHVIAPVEQLGRLIPIVYRANQEPKNNRYDTVDFDTESGETVAIVGAEIRPDGRRIIVVDVMGDDVKVQVNR